MIFRTLLLLFAVAGTAFGRIGPEVAVSPPLFAPRVGLQPRIATNGDGFLAVWATRGGSVRATRFDRDGNVIDPVGFAIARSGPAAVASDGNDYLVAIAGCQSIDVMTVSRDGVLSPRKRLVDLGGHCAGDVEIASNGASYLVAARSR